MSRHALYRFDELDDPGARGFTITVDGEPVEGFVVRHGTAVHAYLNRCPHARLPLEWQTDRFLDDAGNYIFCANHAALFRIEDGYCIAGPCAQKSLTRLPVAVREGWIYYGPED